MDEATPERILQQRNNKTYQITEDNLETTVNKIPPNKASVRDLTVGFW